MPSLPRSLSVLREREYRLLLAGQIVSLLGDQMVSVALAFAVIEVGGTAGDVGVVFAARALALVASLLIGGVIADRLPRRIVLIGADLVRLGSQGGLAAALILGSPSIADIAVLSAITGMSTGFFNPASTGFLVSVVSPAGVQQANALRGLSASSGRIAGPLLAAALIATVGAGWALAVDAATFAVSAALLSRMRSDATGRQPVAGATFLGDFRDGWDAFRSRTWLWSFVAFFAWGNVVYAALTVVGPLIAERDLGGATAWGTIIAASGVGGLIGGAVALHARPSRPLLVSAVAGAGLLLPGALLAAGLPVAVVACAALISELGLMLELTLWESTLQRHVEPEMLSRVSAYDWFVSMAPAPIGLALWGALATTLGYENTLWLAFALHAVGVAALLSVRDIRRLPPEPASPPAAAVAALSGPGTDRR
ncbi:MAG: transporter [Conexibacter sp.]|nr:transporter [Conexibacter sp.]